jgi:hypothetical protein
MAQLLVLELRSKGSSLNEKDRPKAVVSVAQSGRGIRQSEVLRPCDDKPGSRRRIREAVGHAVALGDWRTLSLCLQRPIEQPEPTRIAPARSALHQFESGSLEINHNAFAGTRGLHQFLGDVLAKLIAVALFGDLLANVV